LGNRDVLSLVVAHFERAKGDAQLSQHRLLELVAELVEAG
jgi:hypothetical protein